MDLIFTTVLFFHIESKGNMDLGCHIPRTPVCFLAQKKVRLRSQNLNSKYVKDPGGDDITGKGTILTFSTLKGSRVKTSTGLGV